MVVRTMCRLWRWRTIICIHRCGNWCPKRDTSCPELHIEYKIKLYLGPRFPEPFPSQLFIYIINLLYMNRLKIMQVYYCLKTKASILTFITALFTIAKRWKQPECSRMNGRINKMWFKNNGILFNLQKEWISDTYYNVQILKTLKGRHNFTYLRELKE